VTDAVRFLAFERRRLLARTGGRDLPYRGMLGPRRETKGAFLR